MADTKISALTALAGANVASDDPLPIVDTSVTTTKKINASELKIYMSASPTLVTPNIGVATGTSLDVSGVLESGANAGTGGQLKMFGATSGDVTLGVAAAAGTATVFTLPATNGTNKYALITNGSGVTSWGQIDLTAAITGTLPVANGGTGITSFGTGVATALGNNTNAASGLAVLNGSGYLAVAQGGTGLGSGTSGGVLYYSATGTLASSAALAANALVIGGGAGVAPSTTTTGANVLTFLGTPSSANLAAAVTDETGTGSLVFSNSPTFNDDITLGVASTATGSAKFVGTTSGIVTLSVADAAGTWTMKLPTSAGTNGYVLQTDGSGATSWVAQSGGGGTPGGTDTQVQFNDGGSTFGGDAGLTYNKSTNFLTVTGGGITLSSSTINKVTITAPATGSTLTVADGKTATFSNSITFAGTDSTTMTFPSTSSTILAAGKQTIWVPAIAMVSRTTNGAANGIVETSTNKIMFNTLDFDPTTQEFAQFAIRMPKSWNESTVTAVFTWSHASTTTNFGVVWALEAVALSNDDAGDAAFGTAQQVADTGGTTNDIYVTSETSAITIGGTPAAEDWVVFQVKRVPADGSDTMAIDARLHGVTLFYTTDAANDA